MRERIKQVMKDIFDLTDIPDDIFLKNCVEWDSMRHLQLVVGLETEFDVSFEPEDIAKMQSITVIEEILKPMLERIS